MTPPDVTAAVENVADLDAEKRRGRRRYRRVGLAALGNSLFRVVSTVGSIVTVPLIVRGSGSDAYGLLAVVTTLATLLAFADLGIGSGLVTELAKADGTGDEQVARELIASAAVVLMTVGVALAGVATVMVTLVPWAEVLRVPQPLAGQATASVAVFAVCFVLGVPASLAQRVHLGLQEGLQASLWLLVGAALAICTTLLCVALHTTVPWFVAAAVGSTTLANALNCLYLFGRRPALRPRLRDVHRVKIARLSRTGALFFVLVTAGALAYQTDALIISVILGTSAVSEYSLTLRLFSLPLLAMTFILAPLWPAYSEALSRGDMRWTASTLRRSMKVSLALVVPSSVALVLFGPRILHLWVGNAVNPPSALWWALAGWIVLNALTQPLAMLCNGAGVVRMQVISALAMTVINLGLSIALTIHLGVVGPVLGSLVAAFLCSLLPYAVTVRRLLRDMHQSTAVTN